MKIALLYLGDKLLRRIALGTYASIIALTSTSFLIIDLRLLMWLDMVAFVGILKLSNYNFRELVPFY